MNTKTNKVMILTQNIKTMLNQLQELADDHFELNPEYITDEQTEELQIVHKWLKATLKKQKEYHNDTKAYLSVGFNQPNLTSINY